MNDLINDGVTKLYEYGAIEKLEGEFIYLNLKNLFDLGYILLLHENCSVYFTKTFLLNQLKNVIFYHENKIHLKDIISFSRSELQINWCSPPKK